MSDERQPLPNFTDEVVDESAPTERDPSVRTVAAAPASSPPPARGAALSVLWWREGDDEEARPSNAGASAGR